MIEYAINMSDAVTVVSENLKEETLEHFNIKNEIQTIPNFIDMSLYQKKADEKLRNNLANDKKFIITHISNFRKVKRVEDVIKVFNKVCQNKSVKLLMIGDGPERIKAEQLCRVYGIENQVRFLGKLRVIENILAISDIFILPSETESFGLVALEAMASRTAVISTNSGGLPEVNIDGKTGFLSDVGDIEKMANDTISLLSDIDMLNRFKMNALAHANSFALENILPKYKDIYEKLCCRIEDK